VPLQDFKPASLSVVTKVVTFVAVIAFFFTLVMSFWGGGLATRLTCLVLGVVLLGCWLFSVKAYLVDDRSIIVRHPFWSARFELRGLTPEDQLPSSDAIRLFASNWIFCHSLGVCYSKASGRFISYLTNPEYKLAVDTERGVLVISPRDKAALVRALPE
jgi:hypothetical protein